MLTTTPLLDPKSLVWEHPLGGNYVYICDTCKTVLWDKYLLAGHEDHEIVAPDV